MARARTLTVTTLGALALLASAAPAATGPTGFAAAGCSEFAHSGPGGEFDQESCVGDVRGEGRGSDFWSFKKIVGTASYTEHSAFACQFDDSSFTGRPTYFAVFPDHTAHAIFRMKGTHTFRPSNGVDENGDPVCGDTVTEPAGEFDLEVFWDRYDESNDQVCFSNVPCGSLVPRTSVRRS